MSLLRSQLLQVDRPSHVRVSVSKTVSHRQIPSALIELTLTLRRRQSVQARLVPGKAFELESMFAGIRRNVELKLGD